MAVVFVGVLLAILAFEAPVLASPSEVYLNSGAGYFGGSSEVIAGYGAGVGYRHHLSDEVAVYVEARWLGYLGNAGIVSGGGLYILHRGEWAPAFGGQFATFFGNQIQVVNSENPDPPPDLAVALQARLLPLRFVHDSISIVVLGIDVGAGIVRGSAEPAVTFSLLETGYRF
jgi:hypothetical protein